MLSAVDFFPSDMTVFMNLVTRLRTSRGASVYFGSGSVSRFGTSPLRGIASVPYLLGPLGAVLRPALATIVDARGVERTADDVITDARQILHTAATNEAHRVLLQVVTLAGDVAGDFHPVGEANTSDLTQSRVRLLRRRGVHADAYATLLRARLESRGRGFALLLVAAGLYELVDRRHSNPSSLLRPPLAKPTGKNN